MHTNTLQNRMEGKRDEINLPTLPGESPNTFIDFNVKYKGHCEGSHSPAAQHDATNAIPNWQGFSWQPKWETDSSAPDAAYPRCSSVRSISSLHSEADDTSRRRGNGNKRQNSERLTSIASVSALEHPETRSAAFSIKDMIVDSWKHRNDAPRPIFFDASGGMSRRNQFDSAGASDSITSSQQSSEFSSGEWNFHKKLGGESGFDPFHSKEEKENAGMCRELYTCEAKSRAIMISLLQKLPKELLISRYFHAWWRWIVQKRERKWGDRPPMTASVVEGVPEKIPVAVMAGSVSAFSDATTPSRSLPSRMSGGLATSGSLDVSWHLAAGETSLSMVGSPIAGVEELSSDPTGSGDDMNVIQEYSWRIRSILSGTTSTQSRLLSVSAPSVLSDVFMGPSRRRQVAQDSTICHPSGFHQRLPHSCSGSRRDHLVSSQGKLYAFYFNILEDEETAARIVIEREESRLRRKTQSHAKRVIDEGLMFALCGKRPVSLPSFLRVPPAEGHTTDSLSFCSDEQQDATPADAHSTMSMPLIFCTRKPDVTGVGDIQQQGQEPQKDGERGQGEQEQQQQQQPLVKERLPSSEKINVLQHSANLLAPLRGVLGAVEAREQPAPPSKKRNIDDRRSPEAESYASFLEPARKPLASPFLSAPSHCGDANIQVDGDHSEKSNNSGSSAESKEESDAKSNVKDSDCVAVDFARISSRHFLSGVRYMEFSERERERRCLVLINYREGLERIISVCFGGKNSTTVATTDPVAVKVTEER